MNYFDHAASTFIYPEVLDLMAKSFKEDYANPNSQHQFGSNLLKKIEEARSHFLVALKCAKSDLFIFTSSATESNNTVVRGLEFKGGDVILYSKADHPSIVDPIEKLALDKNLILRQIKLNENGSIDIEKFKNNLDKDVKLVALTHVNNQSGVINEIHILSQLVKENTSAHVHVDAAQSFAKIDLAIPETVDSVSITAHKIGGPKGIAGLYLKKSHRVKPLLLGGGQEGGFRSSTQAHTLIIAFAKASEISLGKKEKSLTKIKNIRDIAQSSLSKIITKSIYPFENTSPYIFTFIVPGIPSDVLLRHLEARGFILSSTSACSSKQKGLNPTFSALNISEKFHKNVVRLSFSNDTSTESINDLVKAFSDVWNDLKFLTKN